MPLPVGCGGSQRMTMWKDRVYDAGVHDQGGEMTEW